MMRQQKKAIVRLIFTVFLVMVLCNGPNLLSQEMKPDTISIEKTETVFEPGEDIRIHYRCSEDNLPYLWIGIFKADIDDKMMKDAGLSIKILGELNASVLLNAPNTPGNYQVRLFSMQSVEVSVHDRLNFEVKEKEDFKDKPGTPEDDIDKNIKVTAKRDAEGIDTPSKTFLESVALEVKKSQEIGVYPINAKTKFKRKEDGFEILNDTGSRWAGLAECLGHVAFAKYYFENHKTEGNLYGRYSAKKYGEYGTTIKNKPTLAAHIIVTLANSKIKQDTDYIANSLFIAENFGSPGREKKIFESMLTDFNKNKPVLLSLNKAVDYPAKTSYHAVLAYANVYDKAGNESKISIYDPNFADEQYLVYNHSKRKFDDYIVTFTRTDKKGKKSPGKLTYKVLKIVGDEADIKPGDLSEILNKADKGFTPDVAIKITSPENESEVCLPHVTVEGTLTNLKKETTQLTKVSIFKEVNEDNDPSFIEYKDESITAKGEFSIKVTLDKGKNKLHFATFAKNKHTGSEYEALNTYEVDDNFILKYKPPTIVATPPTGDTATEITFEIKKPVAGKKLYTSPSFKAKWDFGDDSSLTWEDWSASKTTQHKYKNADTYNVTLHVKDKCNDEPIKAHKFEIIIEKESEVVPEDIDKGGCSGLVEIAKEGMAKIKIIENEMEMLKKGVTASNYKKMAVEWDKKKEEVAKIAAEYEAKMKAIAQKRECQIPFKKTDKESLYSIKKITVYDARWPDLMLEIEFSAKPKRVNNYDHPLRNLYCTFYDKNGAKITAYGLCLDKKMISKGKLTTSYNIFYYDKTAIIDFDDSYFSMLGVR